MPDTLVLVEHNGQRVKGPSLHAIGVARELSDAFALLVLGHGLDPVVSSLAPYGASAILVADDPALAERLADRYAAVIAAVCEQRDVTTILGASSTFTKDVLPRAAALLDLPMLSDVLAIEQADGGTVYQRPVRAGSAVSTVRLRGRGRVLTIRAAAFEPPPHSNDSPPSPVEPIPVDAGSLPQATTFLSRAHRDADRPELSEARIVVAGGRPLVDRQRFDRLIGGLADVLGGAVGASRAVVDAGVAPNDWQIGQTGKTIAPDLYVAVGISGSAQHLAGITDCRVVVAINNDPDAPIVEASTYALIGDLYTIVPRLIDALRQP